MSDKNNTSFNYEQKRNKNKSFYKTGQTIQKYAQNDINQ